MQTKREHSVHVRLSDEGDAMLELLCAAGRDDKAKLAADLLERALMGEGHALRIAAQRLAGLGFSGMRGERQEEQPR